MDKKKLLGFISRYSLGGNVESVKWKSDKDTLITNFVSTDKTLKGIIEGKVGHITDEEIGIFETSQLVRMLSIMQDDIDVSTSKTSLMFRDKVTDFSFVLADLDVIPKVPSLKMTPSFTSTIKITDHFIDRFVKSYGALPDSDFFTIESDVIGRKITFGYSNTNTNRISFDIDTEDDIQTIHFSSNLVREIIVANKGTEGTLEISPVGLARIKFSNTLYKSEYLLVNKQIDGE
mgnify:FL=1|tara:strand:+ start:1131 stop:1829 length:699 start_codon:yes stop_codon:yes gene_type:complete